MKNTKHRQSDEFYWARVRASLWEPGYEVEGDGQITRSALIAWRAAQHNAKPYPECTDSFAPLNATVIAYFTDARNWPDFQAILEVVSVEHVRIEIIREQFDNSVVLTTTREYVREITPPKQAKQAASSRRSVAG